jgi:two-component system nitrate/nitrite response regulator NarL
VSGDPHAGGSTPAAWGSLTRRERQVLQEMMAGFSIEAIAVNLGTSASTVRSQVGGVLHKLGVHSQREAISLAFRSGWSADDRR